LAPFGGPISLVIMNLPEPSSDLNFEGMFHLSLPTILL
jgi:hypothetical protein